MTASKHIEDPNVSGERLENTITYCGERVRRADAPFLITKNTGLVGDSDCDDCLDAYFAFVATLYEPDDEPG